MKAFIGFLVLTVMFASLGQTQEISAKVLNLVQDDEGLKVIAQIQEPAKIQALYLRNDHKRFVTLFEMLKKMNGSEKTVSFQVEKDSVLLIQEAKLSEQSQASTPTLPAAGQ